MKLILFTRIATAICTLVILLSWAQDTNADYVDAFGDAQDSFGAGGPLLDIDTIDVRIDAFNLLFEMTFHTPISAPSLMAANSVGGALEFDIDQSNETGGEPVQNAFDPPFASLGAGVDFRLDLFSEAASPGFVALTDDDALFVANIGITYTSNSFYGEIPLSLLVSTIKKVDFTAIIGTFPQPTDAMDSIGTSVSVPEPAFAGILLSFLAGMLTARRKR